MSHGLRHLPRNKVLDFTGRPMRSLRRRCERAALLIAIVLAYTWLQAEIGDWQALLAVAGAPLALLDGSPGGRFAVRRGRRRAHPVRDAGRPPALWVSPALHGFVFSGDTRARVAVTATAVRAERPAPPADDIPRSLPSPGSDLAPAEITLPMPPIGGSQHCVLFAVDIAQFTDAARDDEVQLAVRDALYRLLTESFRGSGIPWNSCVHEDRGDGVIVIIPAHMPTITVVDQLVEQIRMRLRRYNRLSSSVAQVRLRLAVHIGEVYRDGHGLAGKAVNHLFRMLDAPDLRQALTRSETGLALIVSDYVYQSVIHGGPSGVDPTAYSETIVCVKQFRARAWLLDTTGTG